MGKSKSITCILVIFYVGNENDLGRPHVKYGLITGVLILGGRIGNQNPIP